MPLLRRLISADWWDAKVFPFLNSIYSEVIPDFQILWKDVEIETCLSAFVAVVRLRGLESQLKHRPSDLQCLRYERLADVALKDFRHQSIKAQRENSLSFYKQKSTEQFSGDAACMLPPSTWLQRRSSKIFQCWRVNWTTSFQSNGLVVFFRRSAERWPTQLTESSQIFSRTRLFHI